MNQEDEQRKEKLEAILKDAKNETAARNGLAFLFPKVEQIFRTFIESTPSVIANSNRQLHVKDYASAYFRLDPQPATWPRSVIDEILNTSDPETGMESALRFIASAADADRDRLQQLFLNDLAGTFSDDNPMGKEWLQAIVNASPFFLGPRDVGLDLGLYQSNFHHLRGIIVVGLRPLSPEARARIVKDALLNAYDLSLLSAVFRRFAGDVHPEGASQKEPGFGDETENIRDALLERVKELATDGTFWSQAQPWHIIWFWWGCNRHTEVQDFTRQAMDTEVGLRSILKHSINRVLSSAGNYDRVDINAISKALDFVHLEKRAQQLLIESDQYDDRQLAERFLKALQREREDPL